MTRTVLHVGPVESKGGMQATIRHHERHPPPGWTTETINTHVDGSPLSKIISWRKARKELAHRLRTLPPDVLHVHTATRYSWWRKRRAVSLGLKAGVPVVLQVHAGNFGVFLESRPNAAKSFADVCANPLVTPVALTPRHRDLIGTPGMEVIGSPAPPSDPVSPEKRNRHKLLMLARPSPVKGHPIAMAALSRLRRAGHEVELHLSGVEPDHPEVKRFGGEENGIFARGWVSDDEKEELLRTSGMLLMPSTFEGMPVAAMEALSCGLPVLASQACEGILGDGGRIVDDLSVESWAEAIADLLADKEAWLALCVGGPAAVAEQTPETLGNRWADLYDRVSGGGL
jgi:glycosyltransferase involved in cell wall biosynthesis